MFETPCDDLVTSILFDTLFRTCIRWNLSYATVLNSLADLGIYMTSFYSLADLFP